MMRYSYFDSPVGRLLVYGESCLEGIVFPEGKTKKDPDWVYDTAGFDLAKKQLYRYFQGQLTTFDLKLQLRGTPFQTRVWQALAQIPYGETLSYGQLAARVGNPKAARAVGMANNKNPIPIVLPCHRVIGKNGSLTGFGGGLGVKQFLLDLEQAHG